jgi:hypothetical protein
MSFVSLSSDPGYTAGQDDDSRCPDVLREIPMKLFACCAVLLTLATAPAFAETATPVPASSNAATTPAASAKYTLDTPIEAIAADPKGKAVLDADFPGMTTHAMYDSFKSMSLNQVQPMSGGAISPEALTKAATDLAAIK